MSACFRLHGISLRAALSAISRSSRMTKNRQKFTIFPPMSIVRNSGSTLYFENSPGAYKTTRNRLDTELNNLLTCTDRFQSINKREDRCDMPLEAVKANSKGRWYVTYKGCNLICSPEDYVLYHQLFWYLKPQTVIELGTCEGGSAIWFGDQLQLLGTQGHVYSMDLDLSLLGEGAKTLNPDNVTFLQGDCNEIEKTFTPEMLSKLPHPWVIVEDAHVNLSGTLGYLHNYMKEGDYLVVEDTNPYIPREIGVLATMFDSIPLAGPQKLEELKVFLRKHDEFYAVDSFFTDFYGYNCSWMWHGFIRRMK